MSLIIVIILILLLVGAVPRWGYNRGWGYGPSGLLGVILIVVALAGAVFFYAPTLWRWALG